VLDSEFSNTSGTSPQFGIDIEPNKPGWAYDVLIENCRIRNNQGGGIQVYKRVSGVTIRNCVIEDNHGPGILAVSAAKGVIQDNVIARNGKAGVALRDQTVGFRISGNRFSANATRRLMPDLPRPGERAPASAIRAAGDTQDITITGNRYDHE
jgi:parallel beta-helix repeat protein